MNLTIPPVIIRLGGAFLVIASVVVSTHLIQKSVALTQDPPAEEKLIEADLVDDDLLDDDLLDDDLLDDDLRR